MKFVRIIAKGLAAATVLLVVAYLLIIAWTSYVFSVEERVGASVQAGETMADVDGTLLEDFEKEESSLFVAKNRFAEEEFQALVQTHAKLYIYSYPDDMGPFFFLIFNTDNVLIHKFVPGAN